MNIFAVCPCCSTPLLHHFGNHREYWFCRHCWQEMPCMDEVKPKMTRFSRITNLSTGFPHSKQLLAKEGV